MALGGDFEALKQLAKQQDADRQATLAGERAAKEQQAAKAQAARDARERQERENSRRLLKLKEDQKKRKAEAEEEMERKRAELRKRKREREQKAEEVAKTTKTKLITSKMIRQREKAGLGGRKSKSTSTSSSSDYLPLTRQEKRERREREVLGLDLRRMKAPPTSSPIAGPSRLASAGSSSTPLKSASSARNPSINSKAAPTKKATTSAILRSLERQLVQAERAHKDARSLPASKESSIKVRDTEGVERDLRRKIAMERKAEEERQLARIRAGLPPLIDEGGSSEDEGRGRNATGRIGKTAKASCTTSSDGPQRPETAREKFLREEAERKQASASKTAAGKSAKSAQSQSKKQKSMHFSESEDDSEDEEGDDSDEEDDDDDDGFIDDGDEEGGYDIWSIMNPGKDKSKYLARQVDSDDDMEADADSVFREDQRSSALARLEDRREEERLKQHELEKARRKLDRGRRA